jgi:hypothetical protein
MIKQFSKWLELVPLLNHHNGVTYAFLDKMFSKFSALWRTPNSLKDLNVNPKLKTTEKQGIGAVPWLAAL